ncbi:MAG TPA: selenium cofactor biosynthesis protein YqeC [Desulfobacterales bacterium]|nr:selenium cofactor biosynthesis protein YqeC [Desulfobacterales bacterium]
MPDRLRDALLLIGGGVVSLVGAGGKTSLMFRLARELSVAGETVLTTTTTRIFMPEEGQCRCVILADTAEKILEQAAPALNRHRHITAAAGLSTDPAKLAGLTPDVVDRLRVSQLFDWIIVEADGAAGRPLKAPAGHEPVIPFCTGWLVGMVGLRALGKPLTDQWVFRAELFSRITGFPPGAPVTEEAIVAALVHEQGVMKGAPEECRCLAFLNQADEPGANAAGLKIAGLLKRLGGPRIQRTIVGHVLGEPPIAAVFNLSG